MGNRAVIKPLFGTSGLYLHWNGGVDSVTAFLKYCELKGYEGISQRSDGYGLARLCQVIGNFFGGNLSLGIITNIEETRKYAQGFDNGIYVVDGWKIVKRIGNQSPSEGYDLNEFLCAIDKAQPASEQLGREYIFAEIVQPQTLQIGDEIFFIDELTGKVSIETIVGKGNDEYINGTWVQDLPYIGKFGDIHSNNINNYINSPVRLYKGVNPTNE